MTTLRFAACLPLILALCACNSDAPPDTSGHQSAAASSDDDEPDAADHQTPADAVDREAVRQFVERGTDAIPELKQQLEHADPGQRLVARVALAKITGQWGWEDGLVWCRSVEDATRQSAERRAARLREIEATPDSAEPDEHLRLLMDGDGTMTGTPLLVLHLFGQFDEEFC